MRRLAAGERDRLKIEAEGRAQAVKIEAEAQATAIVIQAQARAQAIELERQALQSDERYLQLYYIEKLAPNVRVMLVPSNAPFLLPLPDLMSDAAASSLVTTTLTNTLGIPPVVASPTPISVSTPAP